MFTIDAIFYNYGIKLMRNSTMDKSSDLIFKLTQVLLAKI